MLRRSLLPLLAVVITFAALPVREAHAGWGLRNSFGQSIYIVPPKVDISHGCYPCFDGNVRSPVNLEMMPYYSFHIITIDLGLLFNLEQRDLLGWQVQLRPGIRIFPFLGLYIRASIPLAAAQIGVSTAYFQWNLSVGAGYEFSIGPWGIFAEFDFNPSLRVPFNMPVEFRLGFRLGS
jgi:hypothetical protein